MGKCNVADANQVMPMGPMIWFGSTLYWIGSVQCDGQMGYVLMAQKTGGEATLVWELAHPSFCDMPETGQYHVLVGSEDDMSYGTISDQGEQLSSPSDPVAALSDCRARFATTTRRFIKDSGQRILSLAVGRDRKLALLSHADGDDHLAWFDDTEATPLALDSPLLSRHTPVLSAQPDGSFLAYPSLGFDARKSLSEQLPGLPVHVISPRGEVSRVDVPWAEWNASGAYRFAMTKDGLAMALSPDPKQLERYPGGLYLQGRDWAKSGGDGIDSGSLTGRSDGSALAWRSRHPTARPALHSIQTLEI